MRERTSDLTRSTSRFDPPPRGAPPRGRLSVPPPPADAPFWLHPLALGGALAAVLVLALVLWMLPGSPPSDDLTPEELAALLAEPPPATELPPRWETPTRLSDLYLSTDPSGASVRLNNEWVGTTPIRLDDIRPGFYELRVVKPAYATRDTSFYLASGSLLQLGVPLAPERSPAFSASPPAPQPRAAAPPAARAADAPRRIQQPGQPAGGGAASPEFEVASPEVVRQTSHTGSLSITSNPSGAIVLVDGVPFGRAPLALSDLRPGTYVVTVTLPGHTPLSYQAEVTAQSVAVVKAAFPPSER
jgi:hypothetical protein